MVKTGIVFAENGNLDYGSLPELFDGLFQEIEFDSTSELNLIILDLFESSVYLDSVLGRIYSICRDVLLLRDLHLMPINILFGAYNKEALLLDHIFLPNKDLITQFKASTYQIFDVPRSITDKQNSAMEVRDKNSYTVSALGGTFDHIHDGHKILLSIASFITESRLIVGVTHEELLLKKKYKEYMESFERRCDNVRTFLSLLKPTLRVEIVPIKDVCGPTGTVPEIQCLVVSRETVAGGQFVNKTRVEKGLPELDIVIVNVLGGNEDDGWKEKLSSTEVRKLIMSGQK